MTDGTMGGTKKIYKRKAAAVAHDRFQTTNMASAEMNQVPAEITELSLDTTPKRCKDALCVPDGFMCIKCLAKGAQARIYLLARCHDGKLAVLKTPRIAISGIAREYECMKQIHRDGQKRNVLAPIKFFPRTESLLLEWAPCDLFTLLENNGAMHEKMVITMANDVQKGLEAIHESQFIHMDIKPENILVCVNSMGASTFKVADLGLACDMNTVLVDKPGSPAYAPPELMNPEPLRATPSIDMWSFGVTLYVASKAFLPWSLVSDRDDGFVRFWQASDDVRFDQIPSTIVQFIKSTLCIDPSNRKWPSLL